ncbi:DUF1905 domain-containing protein [Erythrobacter rubeus]|uniref:DUF1905 domain-containing protein n=1 Tax=Erythrobacter rubeus TaxID=2760803 RepID=A0ABR8KNS3_9SPHN|nr:DUF1905 domain-containing protein [Erythrobacter rubeus]MBD2840952.1 DUF1905 domain-containing protein [Erythrobacter rubeus]
MSESLTARLPLKRWQGDRGTYHLVVLTGAAAETVAMHARLHRLEFGRQRGFGSVKVVAHVGDTTWKSSVFPQKQQTEWVLLISKKVMAREDLAEGDAVNLELELL